MSEQQKNDLAYIGGLWRSEPKGGGDAYLSGSFGVGAKVMIFKNKFKDQDGENAPDWKMYVVAKAKKDGGESSKDDDLI